MDETLPDFQKFNRSNSSSDTPNQNQLLTFSLSLSSPNQSVHINLRPRNRSLAYFGALKYGQNPVVNVSVNNPDFVRVFCPERDFQTEGTHHFYTFFANISANKNMDTRVGFGFRELDSVEQNTFCASASAQNISQIPLMINLNEYKVNDLENNPIFVRAFASGCYYLDKSTASWSSDGVEVLPDTNITATHCVAYHLTEFAGGLVILPPTPDFDKAFANASFDKNPTIYITAMVITGLYILLFVWCRYMDIRDKKKHCIYLLKDNSPLEQYFYELIVFTGGRKDAGTMSRVYFILGGDLMTTKERQMLPMKTKNKVLQRGYVDSFLMSTGR